MGWVGAVFDDVTGRSTARRASAAFASSAALRPSRVRAFVSAEDNTIVDPMVSELRVRAEG